MSETLIIFTRYPEPGKTKTRMIPALGAKGAAELQRKMTEHTLGNVERLAALRDLIVKVYFSGGNQQLMAEWLGEDWQYTPQASGDLGKKLQGAFKEAFQLGSQQVVIIGIDCPDIDQITLNQAFNSLQNHDLVLGVAEDGGYYLIGLNQVYSELFTNIAWGSDQVLRQTIDIAQELKLKVDYLPTLSDVDYPKDLPIWQKHVNNFGK
ncbi:MAG: TIGR04282 family arsenosugar biosynthesis glycosyltransferase [Cyanobacteria bacterium J06621_8]